MPKKKTMVEGFWERFEECLEETGKSKRELSVELGCDRKMLYQSSTNRAALSMCYVARFCATYGISSDYLLGISDEKYTDHESLGNRTSARTKADVIVEWKPIAGTDGKYEVSYLGEVRRTYKNRPPRMMTAYEKGHRTGSSYLVVKLTTDGKSKETKVSKLVYEAYKGKIPKECSVVHNDGDHTNNELENLVILTRQELGRRTGYKSNNRQVLKLTENLRPVEKYRSAREAARNNGMSYQTVIDRCNGKVKSFLAPDGYVYRWFDELYHYAGSKAA